VYAAAKRCQNTHAPVAELIADALDHDGAIVWNLDRRELLIGEIAEDVLSGLLIEIVVFHESRDRERARHVAQLAY
jgi:hypothetical protein